MKPETIFVTGGAGYIGSHTSKALAQKGFVPVVFDNFSRGKSDFVRWGDFIKGDLLDRDEISRALRDVQPSAVIHFAGLISVGESVEKPEIYEKHNVEGTRNLIEAMSEASVRHLVFSSSAAVYGIPDAVPISDHAPLAPINPYGANKRKAEALIAQASQAGKISAVSLRYFNACGADPDGEIGEAHEPETHLIPLALEAASGKRRSLRVYGSDYPTRDGTCVRDYVHVWDLAQAHIDALIYLKNGGKTDAFNLGTGAGFSVRQIIEAAERVTGKKIEAEIHPRRAGDPAELVADASRAFETLKWKPKHSTLEEILRTAWKWHQSR